MVDLSRKDYVVIVQCDIVLERCSGYFCEKAFHERAGGFAGYPKDKAFRMLTMSCGGCCGRALHRKLGHLKRKLKSKENVDKDRVVVQLSSCIALESFHGPACPHLDYLKALIARHGLDVLEGTKIDEHSEEKRKAGAYRAPLPPPERGR